MKNNELVFIIDKSGSMYGKEEDTAGSFNTVLNEQKNKDYHVLTTTVLFSDSDEMLHDRVDASELSEMKKEDIHTEGCTALYDAVGKTITHIEMVHRYIRKEDLPEHVLVVIITDGMENASHTYRGQEVRKMVAEKKEAGWEFVFLGADIDAAAEAESIGLEASRAVSFRKETGMKGSLGSSLNKLAAMVFENRANCCADVSWREDLDKDYQRNK